MRTPFVQPDCKVFKQRLITISLYVRDPRCPYFSYPMHPSDWLHAGLTEDVRLLWDIDLQPEPNHRWFLTRPLSIPTDADGAGIDPDTRRFYAEQYIWRTLLMKFGPVDFEDRGTQSPELTRLTELSFANNLIILDIGQFPLISHKHPFPPNPARRVYRLLMHQDWRWLYLTYCGKHRLKTALSKLSTPHFYLKKAYDASFAPLQMLREMRRRLERA